jgi:hypothetical protein
MDLLKSFFNSEKGVFAYLLPMLGITVLAIMGKITVEQYVEYMIYFAGIYTGGKAIQGAGSAIGKNGGKELAEEAKAEIEVLKAKIVDNDAAIDAALEAKFKEREADNG